MTKKREVEFGSWFTCLTCGTEETAGLKNPEFVGHMTTVHGAQKPIQGTRNMTMHVDSADNYVSSYNWKFGDVRAVQTIVGPRGGRR